MNAATYVLPIKSSSLDGADELTDYLRQLRATAPWLEVIVVDGSPAEIFAEHARCWTAIARHLEPGALRWLNGKVSGALTGIAAASHDKVVIADDDVRYDADSLYRVINALDHAEIVRPQNYFAQDTWHTLLDSGRALLNRVTGGDWPGTLGLRRTILRDGYSGNVLFENLELVRTVRALGGKELVAYDIFVARRTPTLRRFLDQRVRQAYDEFARPHRMALALLVVPLLAAAIRKRRLGLLAIVTVSVIAAAETGRLRAGAGRYFSALASIAAPLWILERGIYAWLAIATRLRYGGVPYAGSVIRMAATPSRILARRFA
jgi:Glycosyl transferase family 2